MKKWQRIWLYIAIIYSVLHLIRDISQDMGIKNVLSTPFVREHPNFTPWWFKYSTYPFEMLMIALSFILLKKNKFESSGYLTIIATIVIFTNWLIYWNYL